MSVKLYIVGDSNVDRYFPLVKAARNEPSIQDATVVRATNLAQIKEALVPAVPTEVLSILSENIFVLQQINALKQAETPLVTNHARGSTQSIVSQLYTAPIAVYSLQHCTSELNNGKICAITSKQIKSFKNHCFSFQINRDSARENLTQWKHITISKPMEQKQNP